MKEELSRPPLILFPVSRFPFSVKRYYDYR